MPQNHQGLGHGPPGVSKNLALQKHLAKRGYRLAQVKVRNARSQSKMYQMIQICQMCQKSVQM